MISVALAFFMFDLRQAIALSNLSLMIGTLTRMLLCWKFEWLSEFYITPLSSGCSQP